jgi:hypothetical protein
MKTLKKPWIGFKVMAAGGKKQAISTHQLKALAKAFGVQPLAEVFY